jgi:DNA-binding Lrp family transcriptional regulator
MHYRIRRLYASGVIRGSSILLNPNLLGLKYGAYVLDVSPLLNKPNVLDRLKRVEGTLFLHDFIDSLVWIGFVYQSDSELQSRLDVFKETAGAEGIFSRIPYPDSKGSMNYSKAKLILRLLRGEFESYDELASEVGISVRTLKRTLSKLVEERAIYSLPKLDYESMTNCVPADLLLLFRDAETARTSGRRILPLVADYLVFAALWDTLGMCSLILPDVGTMSRIADSAKRVEGVASARIDIVRERIDRSGVLGGYMERWMKGGRFQSRPLQKALGRHERSMGD